jgi:hypothetical protein
MHSTFIFRHEAGSACYLLQASFLPGLFFDPEDGSKMFLKTLADFQQTIWRHIPEDRTIQF